MTLTARSLFVEVSDTTATESDSTLCINSRTLGAVDAGRSDGS